MGRTLCWFSCGAPSAVAAKLMVSSGRPETEILYTHVEEEHPDNRRFLLDCEKWIGQKVIILTNEKYKGSIFEVFEKQKFVGTTPGGAPCTRHLKRKVREAYQRPDDTHVLGFTIEELERFEDFCESFPGLKVECPLIEQKVSKADCLSMIDSAGIEIPAMYKLGYNNNNCIGCVKGGAGYWNKIRRDFPERFARMAALERRFNHSVLKRNGAPLFLDELPLDYGRDVKEPEMECSFFCMLAKQQYGG